MNKSDVHTELIRVLQQREEELRAALDELKTARDTESKSTAGDKHEVGRAMVQAEMDRLEAQWLKPKQQLQEAKAFDATEHHEHIQKGSLFEMDGTWYYLLLAYGKLVIKTQTVMVISMASPLGQLVLGKKTNMDVSMNGKSMRITQVK